jgi:adenylosuccinate lyase
VLLALVEAGVSRDDSYRLVQEAAKRSHQEKRHLREILTAMPEVMERLSGSALNEVFDLQRVLSRATLAVDAVDALD